MRTSDHFQRTLLSIRPTSSAIVVRDFLGESASL